MQTATSLQAYENKKPTIKNDHDRILSVLSEKGQTYQEIAKKLNWSNPNKVSRRMPELIRQGRAVFLEVRKCTVAKSNCSAYIKVHTKICDCYLNIGQCNCNLSNE